MGMDGLSMANTGALRESTSRDFATKAEESIKKNDATKEVDKMGISPKINEDEERNKKNGKQNKDTDDTNDDASSYTPSETEGEEEKSKLKEMVEAGDDLSSHKFYVKITKDGEIFELYDKDSDRLVEKISSEEINQLMLKLNMASGILINRKV